MQDGSLRLLQSSSASRNESSMLVTAPDDVDTTLLLENVRSLRDDPKSWDVWETRESLKQLRGD